MIKGLLIPVLHYHAFVNSLWPSDAIWLHRSGSMAQEMPCYLTAQHSTAPSHYLSICCQVISEVLWHSPDFFFQGKCWRSQSFIWVWKLLFQNYSQILQGSMSCVKSTTSWTWLTHLATKYLSLSIYTWVCGKVRSQGTQCVTGLRCLMNIGWLGDQKKQVDRVFCEHPSAKWASLPSKSQATLVFVQQFVQVNNKGSKKALHYWTFMSGIFR